MTIQPDFLMKSRPSRFLAIDDLTGGMPDHMGEQIAIGNLNAALTEARTFGVHMEARADSAFGWEGDGQGRYLPNGGMSRMRRRNDAAMLNEMRKRGMRIGPRTQQMFRDWQEQRADSKRADAGSGYVPGGVGGFPRDFEFIRSKVWEEQRAPLSGLTLFGQDTSVPLGARTHTARRRLGRGVARIMRGDSFVPTASLGFVEEQFGVVYIACGASQNFFTQLTMDFADIDSQSHKLATARRLVEERVNQVIWYGDTASNVYGVLTYPSLAKQTLPLAYDDTPGSDLANGVYSREDLVIQLMDLGSTPRIRSKTVNKPTRLVVSPRMLSFLTGRRHINTGGPDSTMLKYFIDNNPLGIKSVDEAIELENIGPNGEDGILYYADDNDTMHNVMIQSPTTLPVYQSGPFDQLTVVYAAVGGMVMGNVGNCILGLARVRSF